MTKEEFIESPVGTKFLLKPNWCTPSMVWEFIPCGPYGLTEEEQYERNNIRAKEKNWHLVIRHIRNTENNHECYISAQIYNSTLPQKYRYWRTRGMHLIKKVCKINDDYCEEKYYGMGCYGCRHYVEKYPCEKFRLREECGKDKCVFIED